MEDILDVYQRPYDPLRPVICLDETNQQLIEKRRIPPKPGSPRREDYAYRRCGVVDLFVVFEPLASKRVVKLTDTRTIASLYKAFDPAIARQIAHRLEIHHTPIHASWLNMAEIEIGILSRQCLYQSMPSF